ncbi:hypothetical protein GOODEAATRI_010334 [Goodea atripinnis]|uniref:Uncharacterized protein n=1 Tax=Goodea atripinnis TaxID=208336 RepID=A0ABV0MQY2_9TELE
MTKTTKIQTEKNLLLEFKCSVWPPAGLGTLSRGRVRLWLKPVHITLICVEFSFSVTTQDQQVDELGEVGYCKCAMKGFQIYLVVKQLVKVNLLSPLFSQSHPSHSANKKKRGRTSV